MANPLCEVCLANGIIKPAIDVHHIDSFMNYTSNKGYSWLMITLICRAYVKSVIQNCILLFK